MRLTLTRAMAQAVSTARLCTRMVSRRKLTWKTGTVTEEDQDLTGTHHVESVALCHAHQEGVAALGIELCAARLRLMIVADP